MPPKNKINVRRHERLSTVEKIQKTCENLASLCYDIIFNPKFVKWTCVLLWLAEIVLCIIVYKRIAYTEIDWKAYMQQVDTFVHGIRNYTLLVGDTGPLVYPAGHLYIYTAFYYLTKGGLDIDLAQRIFIGLYLVNLIAVFGIYAKCKKVPPYALIFACLTSYRVHSLFILRLFNDPIASLLCYMAIWLFVTNNFRIGCLVYSLAVSVKMNILLYAPALFVILLAREGPFKTIGHLSGCAFVQLVLAAPFLLVDPIGYINRAFNFGRVFMYQWTVNWRFLPEQLFTDSRFHLTLLVAHVVILLVFAFLYYFRRHGGLTKILSKRMPLDANDIVVTMFTANFIGVMFSRTLHYQFYVWYFHTLPYLLWSTKYWPMFKLAILGVIELCWYTYPSTNFSSGALHVCHILIFFGLCYTKGGLTTRPVEKWEEKSKTN